MTLSSRSDRPRLLDLFCCQGGAAVGYHRAGFEVIGVDKEPQPNYPFQFIRADAVGFLDGYFWSWTAIREDFAAIHASPPCQAYLALGDVNKARGRTYEHDDLIAPIRSRLIDSRLPYVIENVVGAPLRNPVQLCGSSFGLVVQRHRLFESNVPLMGTPCAHHLQTEKKYPTNWRPGGEKRLAKVVQVYGNAAGTDLWPEAMGIDWMDTNGLREAIPPAYTEHIGGYLMAALNQEAA